MAWLWLKCIIHHLLSVSLPSQRAKHECKQTYATAVISPSHRNGVWIGWVCNEPGERGGALVEHSHWWISEILKSIWIKTCWFIFYFLLSCHKVILLKYQFNWAYIKNHFRNLSASRTLLFNFVRIPWSNWLCYSKAEQLLHVCVAFALCLAGYLLLV